MKISALLSFTLVVLLITGSIQVVAADPDKSGVKPSVISLPSGAGSIEGLGESFEPQLNTGSSTYGMSIHVPPGRAGLEPKIRIEYNSNTGNSFVGIGWNLRLPSIKRQTDKGFPEYNNSDVYIFGGEELVPLANADFDWRCENETQFQRFRRIDTDNDGLIDAWEMVERNGIRHIMGEFRGQTNRWSTVEHDDIPKTSNNVFDRTYCWALNTTIDLHGNRIEYEYLEPTSGVLYPKRIIYSHHNGNFHDIRFRYEDRTDVFDDYRPTFSVQIDQRLIGVDVFSFYDGQFHQVRVYDLEYEYRPEDQIVLPVNEIDLGVSTLKRFVQRDNSGKPGNFLPPLIFEYTHLNLSSSALQALDPEPGLDLADPDVQIADIDGDSLPDLFATVKEGPVTTHQVALNLGQVPQENGTSRLIFEQAKVLSPGSEIQISTDNVSLSDFNDDGLIDLVRIDDEFPSKRIDIFSNLSRFDVVNRELLGFQSSSPNPLLVVNASETVSFSNPSVRQMDLNFDKVSDFLRIDSGSPPNRFQLSYRNREGTWKHDSVDFQSDMPDTLLFDQNGERNPAVHLADMNGDRILDLVYLDKSGETVGATLAVHYWPYCAVGQWASKRKIELASGDSFQVDALDLRDVFVQDFTGDGLSDILVIRSTGSDSALTLRVNIAGKRWSPPFSLGNLPRFDPRDPFAPTIFRQADLNSNGSTDLIWRNTGTIRSWHWLDLMPTGKPNLLSKIDNSIGKQVEITYGNAVDDMIRARNKGSPWQTKCPVNIQVVRRIRTNCGFDLDGMSDPSGGTTDNYVSEFRYRDAFYDAFEREFRGFAFAERIDYGDDFIWDENLGVIGKSSGWDRSKTPTRQVRGPSLVTRYRFHTGAADQQDNDEPPADNQSGLVDEFTELGGREEECLKGKQLLEEKVDPWVLHNPSIHDFDANSLAAAAGGLYSSITDDSVVYTRARQFWGVRRLYRPGDAVETRADSNSDGVLEDLGSRLPVPEGRFHPLTVRFGSGRSVSFAFVQKIETDVIEANGLLVQALGYESRDPRQTRKEFDFDDFGNSILEFDHGILDPEFDDERKVSTTYAHGGNALSLWIIDRPDSVTTTDENGLFVNKTVNFYDGDPYLGVREIIQDRALLHRVQAFIDPDTTINAQRSEYDPFGNMVGMRDPNFGTSFGASGGHSRSVSYDAVFHMYPVKETIVVGGESADLSMSATYDFGFGVVTSSTDFNGNVTSYDYDSFSRLVAIVKPFDSSEFPTALYQYQVFDPHRSILYSYDRVGDLDRGPGGADANRVVTHAREVAGGSVYTTAVFSDGCGKVMAEVGEGVVEQDGAKTWIVSKTSSYNLLGAEAAVWLPYQLTSDSIPKFNAIWPSGRPPHSDEINPSIVKTDSFADPLGRGIKSLQPPETWGGPRKQTLTQILPFEKRSLDENDSDDSASTEQYHNTPLVHFQDGLGRLVKVHEVVRLTDTGEAGELTNWETTYSYDLNDQLTRIVDSQNNVKTFAYDGIKRKLFMNDPDRGTMEYVYDAASNLLQTTDAKEQVIQYTYDGVNRLLSEDYRDGLPQPPWRERSSQIVAAASRQIESGRMLTRKSTSVSSLLPPVSTVVQRSKIRNRKSINRLAANAEDGLDVIYHYDVPYSNSSLSYGTTNSANNTKGMLSWVEDLTGEEHISYDARSRVEWITKRVPDSQFLSLPTSAKVIGLVSYTTAFSYDSFDRVITVNYPDNDEINYKYNSRNLLDQIVGGIEGLTQNGNVINTIAYQPSAQLRSIDYGNGVRTTYGYDPRLRLTSLDTRHLAFDTRFIEYGYSFDPASNITRIDDNRPGDSVPEGDNRRNSQNFIYDDLYRIIQVKYSFTLPSQTPREGGIIQYRYDRIGNMLVKTSDIDHVKNGLSVTDFGKMNYGADKGSSNRIGPNSNNSPGPHALTSFARTSNHDSFLRQFLYDANGNMIEIDGLKCTWDFKDRLLCVENTEMTAQYAYDYTDRRIINIVVSKKPTSADKQVLTTIYVDKYFEVREYDVPIKYVWNGATRVARVTGSFTSNQRIQRLRLWKGWNLISIAVSLTDNEVTRFLNNKGESEQGFLESTPAIVQSAYKWNQTGLNWLPVIANENLEAGTVLWLWANADAILNIAGVYKQPTDRTLPLGSSFQSGAGLVAWPIIQTLQSNRGLWVFAGLSQSWLTCIGGEFEYESNFPETLSVGECFMISIDTSAKLEVPNAADRISFYYQDHLGSSNVVADGEGELVEDVVFYPFGQIRNEFSNSSSVRKEPYKFSQKEFDKESQLQFFEARYLAGPLGRFLSVDPILKDPPNSILQNPQYFNAYSYALNQPTILRDPTGEAVFAAGALLMAGIAAFYTYDVIMEDNPETFVQNITKTMNMDPAEKGLLVASSLPPMRVMRAGAPLVKPLVKTITQNLTKGILSETKGHVVSGAKNGLARAVGDATGSKEAVLATKIAISGRDIHKASKKDGIPGGISESIKEGLNTENAVDNYFQGIVKDLETVNSQEEIKSSTPE